MSCFLVWLRFSEEPSRRGIWPPTPPGNREPLARRGPCSQYAPESVPIRTLSSANWDQRGLRIFPASAFFGHFLRQLFAKTSIAASRLPVYGPYQPVQY